MSDREIHLLALAIHHAAEWDEVVNDQKSTPAVRRLLATQMADWLPFPVSDTDLDRAIALEGETYRDHARRAGAAGGAEGLREDDLR